MHLRPAAAALLAATTVLLGAGCSSAEPGEAVADPAAAETSPAAPAGEVGRAQAGGWKASVLGVEDPYTNPTSIFKPAAGTRWIALDVEVTNLTGQVKMVPTMLGFGLYDGDTRLTAPVGQGSLSDTLEPNASKRGKLVYQLPAEQPTRGLTLVVRGDLGTSSERSPITLP
ncbi:DUF4352 domain-containing protein [Rhodococcus sp. X156]|uniref:DUF4352 domain-containing protein n=1 Tax=Rhodococcus sp. X156 TaxID=2499145 RepID=UPI000FD8C731|nr:DUF4352 domain-containing protein [Rhodococcus sp. X156]